MNQFFMSVAATVVGLAVTGGEAFGQLGRNSGYTGNTQNRGTGYAARSVGNTQNRGSGYTARQPVPIPTNGRRESSQTAGKSQMQGSGLHRNLGGSATSKTGTSSSATRRERQTSSGRESGSATRKRQDKGQVSSTRQRAATNASGSTSVKKSGKQSDKSRSANDRKTDKTQAGAAVGKPGRKLSPASLAKILAIADKVVDAVLMRALQDLGTGTCLSEAQCACITHFVNDPNSDLSESEKMMLLQGVESGSGNTDAAEVDSSSSEDTGETTDDAVQQSCRYLRVRNRTAEELTVYLHYRTLSDQDEWTWYPRDPEGSSRGVVYHLAPGEEIQLTHNDSKVNASRVRLWAVSESGDEWDQYKREDLWLVPEQDKDGNQCYYAPQAETYTFTFDP